MYKIDLKEKTYTKDGVKYIENGIVVKKNYEIRKEPVSIEELENLYHAYKYSIPTMEEDNLKKQYFKALDINDIPAEALFLGVPRQIARENLELTLLMGILNKSITWESLGNPGTWFWQSNIDKDFVILKNWIM